MAGQHEATSKVGTLIKQSVSYYINNGGPQKPYPFCLSLGPATSASMMEA